MLPDTATRSHAIWPSSESPGTTTFSGRFGSPESKERYRRLIAEYLSAPTQTPVPAPLRPTSPAPFTVGAMVLSYWEMRVSTYYVKHGRPTSEQDSIRQALRFMLRLYESSPAIDFGPPALETVQLSMIEAGRCRSLINKDVSRIRGVFAWAVEKRLLPPEILTPHQGPVEGLPTFRFAAREAPEILRRPRWENTSKRL